MSNNIDPYDYVYQIFSEKKEKLKEKRKSGALSKMHYEHEVKKIDPLLKSGTLIVVKNNGYLEYFVRIANPVAFVKRRGLQKRYQKIFYFRNNEIIQL